LLIVPRVVSGSGAARGSLSSTYTSRSRAAGAASRTVGGAAVVSAGSVTGGSWRRIAWGMNRRRCGMPRSAFVAYCGSVVNTRPSTPRRATTSANLREARAQGEPLSWVA
jgi:hypothetical protein